MNSDDAISADTGSKLHLGFFTEEVARNPPKICKEYWTLDSTGGFTHTVASIGKRFNLAPSAVSALVERDCRAYFPDAKCTRCGKPHQIKNRADFTIQKSLRNTPRVCHFCREAEQLAAQRAAEEQRRLRALNLELELSSFRSTFGWVPPRVLAFEDAVYILSLFRAGGTEDLSGVVPHDDFAFPLSPTTEFDRRILDRLYRRRIIAIHPGSRHDAIVGDQEPFTSFFPFKVHWLLPIPEDGPSSARYLEDLEAVLSNRPEWPRDWEEDAPELQRAVALEECQQYLSLALDEHGFDPRPTEKLTLVLRSVLKQFSVGQTFNFIWRAARDAAAFYVREQTARAHARNIVPGSIQRAAERAVAEAWTVKGYRRDRRAPESQISHVLFTMALKLPDGGLNAVPPPPLDPEPDPER